MAALVSLIAGRYSGTFVSNDLGVLEDPGWRLGFTPDHQSVNNTDGYGSQVIEGIWRGFSSVTLDFRSIEWKTGTIAASNFGNYVVSGVGAFTNGLPGRLGTVLSGAVILSAVSGIPAELSPASATFAYCLLREGFNVEWQFGTQYRVMPIGFRVLPSSSTGALYWTAT